MKARKSSHCIKMLACCDSVQANEKHSAEIPKSGSPNGDILIHFNVFFFTQCLMVTSQYFNICYVSGALEALIKYTFVLYFLLNVPSVLNAEMVRNVQLSSKKLGRMQKKIRRALYCISFKG